jgi:hypothetical protein
MSCFFLSYEIHIGSQRKLLAPMLGAVTFIAISVANNVTEQTTVHNPRYVAYYRVCTQRQGRSGLGLEAQRKAVIDRLCVGAELVPNIRKSKADAGMTGQGLPKPL